MSLNLFYATMRGEIPGILTQSHDRLEGGKTGHTAACIYLRVISKKHKGWKTIFEVAVWSFDLRCLFLFQSKTLAHFYLTFIALSGSHSTISPLGTPFLDLILTHEPSVTLLGSHCISLEHASGTQHCPTATQSSLLPQSLRCGPQTGIPLTTCCFHFETHDI